MYSSVAVVPLRLASCAVLALLLWSGDALADLMVFPTRLVFERNDRAAQLELVNHGKDPATYRIRLVNRRMDEFGGFTDIDAPGPGEQFADALLRHSPRQAVLAPGVSQTVRVSVRKPEGLADGEYRSHLLFERVPEAEPAPRIAPGSAASGELGVQLRALVSVSIPVIVRHGTTTATVTLSGLELHKAAGERPPALGFVLHRNGNRSVYGDLGATFTPRGGAEQQVGKAAGVAVYTPNPLRRGRLELQPPPGLALSGGTLRLTYRERPEAGGKLLAEAALALP